ncbi:hypothetical protein SAMN02745176_03490 [Lutispora thermophila DSM 19022]|uniref:Uncharacterized protein n=1 Tax=Lutispora thermophila DSM 19022 TaxID=1122184 RepID=A0A1M6J3C1_9FIRM|nr:hypothetical protein SAMN02745176_03490 [Lutispora thermophila DSM 19022]
MWCFYYKSCSSDAKALMIKNIALAICVCFIVTSFLSTAFILTHSNHQHDHEGPNGTCAMCIHLTIAKNLLKQIFTATVTNLFSLVLCLFISYCLKPNTQYIGLFTLVSLKVRLDN